MNIEDISAAQMCGDELRLLVYREECLGEQTMVSIPQHELVRFLNAREASSLSKTNPAPLRKIFAVDFDGTLCEHKFPGIGAPKVGAKEALKRFRELGFYIIIWTCRTCHFNYETFGGDPTTHTFERQSVKDMIAWLATNGIEYDEIDDGSRGKPLADIYFDDKAVRVDNNWKEILAAFEHGACWEATNVTPK